MLLFLISFIINQFSWKQHLFIFQITHFSNYIIFIELKDYFVPSDSISVLLHPITLLFEACLRSIDDAFLASTKSNALVMLAPVTPPFTATPFLCFYLHL